MKTATRLSIILTASGLLFASCKQSGDRSGDATTAQADTAGIQGRCFYLTPENRNEFRRLTEARLLSSLAQVKTNSDAELNAISNGLIVLKKRFGIEKDGTRSAAAVWQSFARDMLETIVASRPLPEARGVQTVISYTKDPRWQEKILKSDAVEFIALAQFLFEKDIVGLNLSRLTEAEKSFFERVSTEIGTKLGKKVPQPEWVFILSDFISVYLSAYSSSGAFGLSCSQKG